MVEFEQIMTVIVASAPSLTAIIGVVVAVLKGIKSNKSTNQELINKFETVKAEVIKTKEYEALKDQLLLVHRENVELKKKLNELLTKIDKIKRN